MELIAQKREEFGKKTQSLREARKLPAVMFGKGMESIPLTVEAISFSKVFAQSGETALVDINFDGKSEKVLIKDVQYDPVSSKPIHAGFHKVNLKEKIEAQIPVEVIGEENNELIKSGEGLVLILLNELTVEAFPMDLPSEFTVDVSGITEMGGGITIGQLVYDRTKVKIVDYEDDELLVKIDQSKMEEEPEEEVISEAEALAKVEATKELTEEELKAREETEKVEKEKEKQKEKDRK